jgi:gas vesicle protein
MTENKSHSNLGLFILGFLAGAVLGVLLAPEKGEVTRRKLKRKTTELKDKLEPSLTNIRERVAPVVDRVSQGTGSIISGIKKLEEFEGTVKEELADAFDEEEGLPIDTSLSGHKLELPKEGHVTPASQDRQIPPKPKRKSFFKNLK